MWLLIGLLRLHFLWLSFFIRFLLAAIIIEYYLWFLFGDLWFGLLLLSLLLLLFLLLFLFLFCLRLLFDRRRFRSLLLISLILLLLSSHFRSFDYLHTIGWTIHIDLRNLLKCYAFALTWRIRWGVATWRIATWRLLLFDSFVFLLFGVWTRRRNRFLLVTTDDVLDDIFLYDLSYLGSPCKFGFLILPYLIILLLLIRLFLHPLLLKIEDLNLLLRLRNMQIFIHILQLKDIVVKLIDIDFCLMLLTHYVGVVIRVGLTTYSTESMFFIGARKYYLRLLL